MNKKIVCIVLVLVMVFISIPAIAFGSSDNNVNWGYLKNALDPYSPQASVENVLEVVEDTESHIRKIKLLTDFTAGMDDTYLSAGDPNKGTTIELDLNGHYINAFQKEHVIVVNDTFILKDSNQGDLKHNYKINENYTWVLTTETATKSFEDLTALPAIGDIISVAGGVITGGNSSYGGGGVSVNNGLFIMEGGIIAGNYSQSFGGGVYIREYSGGGFTMNGGYILGNSSGMYGGGIYLDIGNYTMGNGFIGYNYALNGGGGVCVRKFNSGSVCKAVLYGGEIKNNYAAAKGGGLFYELGDVIIGGSIDITQNYRIVNGTRINNNYHLGNENTALQISLGTGMAGNSVTEPGIGMQVGVTIDPKYYPGDAVLEEDLTATNMQYLLSDDERLSLIENSKTFASPWRTLQLALRGGMVENNDYVEVSGSAVKLKQDIFAGISDNSLNVSGSTEMTLDLGGHILSGSAEYNNANSIISIYGHLTIDDDYSSNPQPTHNFKVEPNGLWTFTTDAATTTLNNLNGRPTTGDIIMVTGGCITGGKNSGIYVGFDFFSFSTGFLKLNAGNIIGNTTTSKGGGVNAENGSFEMNGGNIIGNTAVSGGGGVNIYCTFTIGGSSRIFYNTKKDGVTNNIYLNSGKEISFGTGDVVAAPTDMMKIGISTSVAPTATTPVSISINGAETYVDYIVSDQSQYEVNFDTDHFNLIYTGSPEPEPAPPSPIGFVPFYNINIATDDITNGSLSVDKSSAIYGGAVTITVAPNKGFTLETLTVFDKDGKEVAVTSLGKNKYSFTMPSSEVKISATFMEDNTMLNFCVDVKSDDYFYDAVLWAYENGIINGIDELHFNPYAPITRAQIVTALWRAAGSPVVNYPMTMSDVLPGSYYEEAVRWALSEKITNGTLDNIFSPYKPCTRAQMIAFLARFAGVQDADGESGYTDVKPTYYFAAAVKWAKDNEVTNGTTPDTFSPFANCTRAQFITMLYRWMEK